MPTWGYYPASTARPAPVVPPVVVTTPRLDRARANMKSLRDRIVDTIDPRPPLAIHIAGEIKEGFADRIEQRLRARPWAEVRLSFDSPGGLAVEGERLFRTLRNRHAPVSAHVADGALCASAAALIYCAAGTRTAAPGAFFVLHFSALDVKPGERWTARHHEFVAKTIRELDQSLLENIADRLGRPASQVAAEMHKDRTIGAMAARDLGLVTEIIWPANWRVGARI
jgi:ATP-dependent Clp protease, protease subunit